MGWIMVWMGIMYEEGGREVVVVRVEAINDNENLLQENEAEKDEVTIEEVEVKPSEN